MNTNEKCPWEIRPNTIEGTANSILQQHIWETENDKKAPLEWCSIPTIHLIEDLMIRIIFLEQDIRNLKQDMGRA